jgi:hypothetical protein
MSSRLPSAPSVNRRHSVAPTSQASARAELTQNSNSDSPRINSNSDFSHRLGWNRVDQYVHCCTSTTQYSPIRIPDTVHPSDHLEPLPFFSRITLQIMQHHFDSAEESEF